MAKTSRVKKLKLPTQSIARKNFKSLKKQADEADKDLKAILDEHNQYEINDMGDWMESLPIENLGDLYSPRQKVSLQDFKIREGLRKKYSKKQEEVAHLTYKKNEANIDYILEQINQILQATEK